MSQLAFSDLFEYLCYESTAIINIFYLTESDVYRRQILTTKVDPRAIRVEALGYFCINHGDQRFFLN